MQTDNKFFQKEPRHETVTLASCHASPKLFIEWDKMSKAAKNEFETNGPIPCEGGGVPGFWCDGCRFGKIGDPEDPDDFVY